MTRVPAINSFAGPFFAFSLFSLSCFSLALALSRALSLSLLSLAFRCATPFFGV